MTTKEDAIEYLQDIRQHYNAYHEHKEKSAWAGVAIYVLFAGTLLPIQLRGPDEIVYDIIYTAFILIVAALVFTYVRNQFNLKRSSVEVGTQNFLEPLVGVECETEEVQIAL